MALGCTAAALLIPRPPLRNCACACVLSLCMADCKENANPQNRKQSFGSSLQPTKLSFTGAAMRAYDRQAKPAPVKSQQAPSKSLKPIKEAANPVLAKAQKTRVLADMTPKKRSLGTAAPDRDLKRAKTEPEQPPSVAQLTTDDKIEIADEIAGLLEDEHSAESSRSGQAGKKRCGVAWACSRA